MHNFIWETFLVLLLNIAETHQNKNEGYQNIKELVEKCRREGWQ
jgi:hypothetical protein